MFRELLTQGPAELEVTVKEVLLLIPSSSTSPRRQRREGGGQAREEQLQCRPSAPQEQEGPRSFRTSVGIGERDQRVPLLVVTHVSYPQVSRNSLCTMRLTEAV
jgi:hypothetical protein